MTLWRKPLDSDKITIMRGDIHIIKERCKGCRFCVEYCPKDVLEMSEEYNLKGYHPPVAVNPDACLECHLCEMLCPEFAIYITVREEEKTDQLIENKC
ncbi:MAG: 4Fe-4S binding protein [candidate division WOR-3 bacterium]|nr:MAG: 4Fe-4S binding protein [candidate division WOR-3 bacterium]